MKIDGAINLILGALLGLIPNPVIAVLGLPVVETPFYVSILGAVLFGIGVALLLQVKNSILGLGLGGAIAINMLGGLCLLVWLLFGSLEASTLGLALMWGLVVVLVGISSVELVSLRKSET